MNTTSLTPPDEAVESNPAQASLGLLLSPDEFARLCATTAQAPNYNSWAIGLQLPDSVLKVMESRFVPGGTTLALFSSSRGPMYPVVVFQCGGFQLRLMLTLVDPRSHDWFIEASTTGRMRLAINVVETGQLAVMEGRCEARSVDEVQALIRSCRPLDAEQGFLDELTFAKRLTLLGAVRSAVPGIEVQTVQVVVVLFGDFIEQSALLGTGERLH